VTATRTMFFVLVGVLVAITTRHVDEDVASAQHQAPRPAPEAWLQGLAACLLVLVLAWAFVVNPWGLSSAVGVFWSNWVALPGEVMHRFPVPVPLVILVATIGVAVTFVAVERGPLGQHGQGGNAVLGAVALLVGTWLAMAIATAYHWRALGEQPDIASVVRQVESRVWLLHGGLTLGVFGLATGIARASPGGAAPAGRRPYARVLAVLVISVAVWAAARLVVRPALADAVFAVASALDNSGRPGAAVELYARSEHLDPWQAAYPLARAHALGRTVLANGAAADPGAALEDAERALARALELAPHDAAHLRATGNLLVRLASHAPGVLDRERYVRTGLAYLERAVRLAPAYPRPRADAARARALLAAYEREGVK
jgi:hypothetical protein